MAASVLGEFGSVDILVNNVGVSPMVPFLDLTAEDWHQVVGINLHSLFYVTQAFIGPMRQKKWGRIINVTGHAGLRGSPFAAHTCAGKSGAHGFTRSLASEFALDGITCNAVAPGRFDTDERRPYYSQRRKEIGKEWMAQWQARIPMQRDGKPEEFGAMCAFLCSEGAAYITGQTLLVNGGMMYS
jgi:NAD(P)-dependent dehydrogenase (short-subunit alcohol dehydrogenase family)